MSPLTQTLVACFGLIMAAVIVLWCLGTALRDVSLVDPFWGTGFVLTAGLAWYLNGPTLPRGTLLTGMTTLWGLRLSVFLLWRNWGHGEDRRYGAMRDYHGPRFWWVSLLTVFLLQGLIMWIVALPLQVAIATNSANGWSGLDVIGVTIWAIGLIFETFGDWQLARFKADPENAGRVMDRGLWRYTRHPNYFGDFCVWWGLYLVAASGNASWTVISPLLMSILLMRVSGVTLLEITITERRPDYAKYRERTNAFFPGPPRSR